MTNSQKITIIREIAVEVGGRFRDSYSGSGMYGDECVGISCDDADECLEVAGERGIRGAKIDSLGRGYIVYWPSIRLEEEKDVS